MNRPGEGPEASGLQNGSLSEEHGKQLDDGGKGRRGVSLSLPGARMDRGWPYGEK